MPAVYSTMQRVMRRPRHFWEFLIILPHLKDRRDFIVTFQNREINSLQILTNAVFEKKNRPKTQKSVKILHSNKTEISNYIRFNINNQIFQHVETYDMCGLNDTCDGYAFDLPRSNYLKINDIFPLIEDLKGKFCWVQNTKEQSQPRSQIELLYLLTNSPFGPWVWTTGKSFIENLGNGSKFFCYFKNLSVYFCCRHVGVNCTGHNSKYYDSTWENSCHEVDLCKLPMKKRDKDVYEEYKKKLLFLSKMHMQLIAQNK